MRRFASKIARICGPDSINTAYEDRICYGYDATGMTAIPDLVVHPCSTEEIAAIVTAAASAGVAVVPRGAGTGLSGGSVPAQGGLVLSFDRMSGLTVEPGNLLAVAQPGVINWQLKQAAREAGLFYPPDPSSMKICTMGGNVAENAGGPYGMKYGVTGDYVIGLEAVLASGKVVRTGGKTRRDVTGYDLGSLLVGTEGTLAIVTEITVRLIPWPESRSTALIAFPDIQSAGEAVLQISLAGVLPAALEIMDHMAITCVSQFHPGVLPGDAAAILLVELDGERGAAAQQLDRAIKAGETAGGSLVRAAANESEAEEIWEVRRAVAPALGRLAPNRIGEDISVPVGSIPKMLERIAAIGSRHDLKIAVFGHAGDGNLHPNILTDRSDAEITLRTEAAIDELFSAAVDLGGTLSGEHGIGIAKARHLNKAISEEQRELMEGIKQVFDPAGLLNPGKIFPRQG